MKEIVIKLDFRHGPLWKDELDIPTGVWSTGIKVIDEDAAVQALNDTAENMFTSLYSFDKNNAFEFDSEKFEKIKPALLSIIQTLILRLTIINDGSYIIRDEETARLKSDVTQLKTA